MALTLVQVAGLVDDPSLGQRVAGAALAVTAIARKEDPKSADYAAKIKLGNKVLRSPQASGGGDVSKMSRLVLSEWYNTPKLSWNDSPAPGQSNLVITATDDEIVALLQANWGSLAVAE